MDQSVPKRRHTKFRRRGITQNKTYNNHKNYEDGTDRVFRNVGIQNSDARELPRTKHTTTIRTITMEQTVCSETSAYKIQTPGNYPEQNIQQP
jgi:hypothetical protein